MQGRTVVVFPRFLRFFLRFLSEVEGVFPHFFVETPFGNSSFVQTFFKGLPFFFRKKNFYSKKYFFLWRGEVFFFFFFFYFSKYPQKLRIITMCVCVFSVQHKTVSAELNFSLWRGGKKEKYENDFLITWQSYLQIFKISAIRHTPSFVQFHTLLNKNLVRFVVCWKFVVDSLTTCSSVSLCCCNVSSPVCCAINPFCLVKSSVFRSSSSSPVCCGPGKGH